MEMSLPLLGEATPVRGPGLFFAMDQNSEGEARRGRPPPELRLFARLDKRALQIDLQLRPAPDRGMWLSRIRARMLAERAYHVKNEM